ncbi:hypothetical protein QA635_08145 [Bradyrhizobium brasilense]|uniref:hypothetical protein n=1 Tax=Bradyrhizobium brasilense TaxID=1419277 RepID=UPI0024B13654|nr:hypothetical protein [Bradyrhizobium australafricanum]WFU37235.1 hypothetical protein QA635_08145 [Bradyrhizobium australafricanum]
MWLWVAFILFVFFLVALDLGVFHREARTIAFKEALMLSAGWITIALAFNVVIFFLYENHWFGLDLAGSEPDGRTAAVLFFTGFLIEKSLGLDNLFFHRLDFLVLPHSDRVSASRTILGNLGCSNHARRVDSWRHRVNRAR